FDDVEDPARGCKGSDELKNEMAMCGGPFHRHAAGWERGDPEFRFEIRRRRGGEGLEDDGGHGGGAKADDAVYLDLPARAAEPGWGRAARLLALWGAIWAAPALALAPTTGPPADALDASATPALPVPSGTGYGSAFHSPAGEPMVRLAQAFQPLAPGVQGQWTVAVINLRFLADVASRLRVGDGGQV
ncbi:MAG: hypothetical protein JNM07_15315, partial [Phycisphaerae bacterium]|nr:hypothetical protein [Phycisphaerae bacterium]